MRKIILLAILVYPLGAQTLLRSYIVSALPSPASTNGVTLFVDNGSTATDCTVGGGVFLVPCKSNGSAWVVQSIGAINYPGAGIANSTGSAWGTSYGTTGTGSTVVLNNGATLIGPALGTPASGVLTHATGLPLSGLVQIAADSITMNATGGSASPTAVSMPTSGTNGCAGTSNALTYNTTTHALGCNTISGGGSSAFNAITSGTNTTAAMIIGSGGSMSVTGSGTNAATSVPGSGITGANSIPASTLPLATTGAFGAVKPDGTTITVSGGVISAASGSFSPSPAASDNTILFGLASGYGFGTTGSSGALCIGTACAGGVDGTIDIVTSVVPRLAAANPWTGSNDFSGASAIIMVRGSGAPSAGCTLASQVGSVYVRSDVIATAGLYACQQTSSSVYGWVLQ